FQWAAIAFVQFLELLQREIREAQARSNVERRLIHVRDEHVRFGGIRDRHGQLLPRAAGIKRTLVVPGTEQTEHFAGEITGEKPVDLVHSPDEPLPDLGDYFAPQEALKVGAGTSFGIPEGIDFAIGVQLIDNRFGQGPEEVLGGFQMFGTEFLEIGEYDTVAILAGQLQPARHQRRLPHLARAFDEYDAVLPADCGKKFLVR